MVLERLDLTVVILPHKHLARAKNPGLLLNWIEWRKESTDSLEGGYRGGMQAVKVLFQQPAIMPAGIID